MRGDFEGGFDGRFMGREWRGSVAHLLHGGGNRYGGLGDIAQGGGVKGQKGGRGGWMTSMPIPRTGRGLWGVPW